MKSMTGYGRAEYSAENVSLTVEIKTVNNRNFDFNAKMPRAFISLEDGIRKCISNFVKRGRVDLFITFSDRRENKNPIEIDFNKANEYYQAIKQLSEKFNVPFDCTASFLLKSPDVVVDQMKSDASDLEEVLIKTVSLACENLNAMREVEGEKLIVDMLNRMQTIEDLKEKISLRAPLVAKEHKEKLKARIIEALEDVKID